MRKLDDDLLDTLSLLALKNQLLCASIDQLKGFYKDETAFLSFLDTIALMSQREPAFFLLSPEIKNRIITVIEIHKYSVNEEVLDYINEVLVYLNHVENVSDEMIFLMVKSYKEFHENIRNMRFNDAEDFLNALSYDAIFMNALEDNNMENLTNSDLNMSSFNYMISISPEFFNIDGVMEKANDLLEQEKKHTKVFSKKKKNIVGLKHSLDLINGKEE